MWVDFGLMVIDGLKAMFDLWAELRWRAGVILVVVANVSRPVGAVEFISVKWAGRGVFGWRVEGLRGCGDCRHCVSFPFQTVCL